MNKSDKEKPAKMTYQVWCYFQASNSARDYKLESMSKGNWDGCGTDFVKMLSDHSWSFKRESSAKALVKKLKRFRWIKKVEIIEEKE